MSEWIRLTFEDEQSLSLRSSSVIGVAKSELAPYLTEIYNLMGGVFYVTETPDEVRALLDIAP